MRARKPTRLTVVMTREEIKAVLAKLTGDKWHMASLTYGARLRLMEYLCLRMQDIDFFRNEILVRDGKGAKDRITMLPESLEAPLQEPVKKVKMLHGFTNGTWQRTGVASRLGRRLAAGNPPHRRVSQDLKNHGCRKTW